MPPSDPYGQAQPGMMPPSGPVPAQGGGGGNKTGLIVLLVVVVLGAAAAGAFFLMSDDDKGPEDVVRSYLNASADGDCDRMAQYVTPALRQGGCGETPDAQFRINDITTTQEEGDTASVTADVVIDGDQISMGFQLVRTDGDWLVAGFDVGGVEVGDLDPGTSSTVQPEGGLDDLGDPGASSPSPPGEALDDPGGAGPSSGPGAGSSGAATAGPGTPPPADGGAQDCFDSAQADCERWAQECFDGHFAACDDLYYDTRIDSPYEDYGATCGGRSPQWIPGQCEATFLP
jgi:hypothetical protein